jgi:hypothetical protein
MKRISIVTAAAGWILILYRDRDVLEEAWAASMFHGKEPLPNFSFGDGWHWSVVEEVLRSGPAAPLKREFIATQNPSVFNHFTLCSADDIRERILIVRDRAVQNLTEVEVDRVWSALEAGIEHVSEIFITRGLW